MPGDEPIAYMERTRRYYHALGYGPPYLWANFKHVPFAPLTKVLAECRVAIVTTAAPYQPGKGDQGPGAKYNGDAKFYSVYDACSGYLPDLRISHVAIDRDHTTAEDIGGFFPLKALQHAAKQGRAGMAPKFYGLPTNRSQTRTMHVDCQDLLARCLRDQVDAVVLVPNCPVCHQTMALAARVLEENSIATVIMGCARDIVEHVGAPRFLFSDFPLGNSAGRPNDPISQAQTLNLALDLLEQAQESRTTWRSPQIWSGTSDWKRNYSNPDILTAEELAVRRKEFDVAKVAARKMRVQTQTKRLFEGRH